MKTWTLNDKVSFIEKVFGKGSLSNRGDNIDIWCPFCAPKDKSKRKLAISTSDDKNHCWTCDWKSRDLIALLKATKNNSYVSEYKTKFIPKSETERKKKSLIETEIEHDQYVELPADFKMLATNTDYVLQQYKDYLVHSRNISENEMWIYKFGVSNALRWRKRVIVPSFDTNGNVNFFVARSIDHKNRLRYDAPSITVSDIVFNELNIDFSKQVVVCEGVFDAIKCGTNAVPLLGSVLNEQSLLFSRILENESEVVLFFDSDAKNKAIKTFKKLTAYNIKAKIADITITGKKDPGELTSDVAADVISRSQTYSWNDLFSERLKKAATLTLT